MIRVYDKVSSFAKKFSRMEKSLIKPGNERCLIVRILPTDGLTASCRSGRKFNDAQTHEDFGFVDGVVRNRVMEFRALLEGT